MQALLVNVRNIVATETAFAALTLTNDVVSWGQFVVSLPGMPITSNAKSIVASQFAFAALLNDGAVVTWGHSSYGGDSTSVQSQLTGVACIESYGTGFAAYKGPCSTNINQQDTTPSVSNGIVPDALIADSLTADVVLIPFDLFDVPRCQRAKSGTGIPHIRPSQKISLAKSL